MHTKFSAHYLLISISGRNRVELRRSGVAMRPGLWFPVSTTNENSQCARVGICTDYDYTQHTRCDKRKGFLCGCVGCLIMTVKFLDLPVNVGSFKFHQIEHKILARQTSNVGECVKCVFVAGLFGFPVSRKSVCI